MCQHTTNNAAAISEMHFTRLNESLENTSNIGWCFVCLVNYQHMSMFHSSYKRRILVYNHAFMNARLQCQRLNCCIPEHAAKTRC